MNPWRLQGLTKLPMTLKNSQCPKVDLTKMMDLNPEFTQLWLKFSEPSHEQVRLTCSAPIAKSVAQFKALQPGKLTASEKKLYDSLEHHIWRRMINMMAGISSQSRLLSFDLKATPQFAMNNFALRLRDIKTTDASAIKAEAIANANIKVAKTTNPASQ